MRAHQRKARQSAPEPPEGGPARSSLGPAQWLLGPGAWERGTGALLALPQPLGLVGESGLLKRFRKPLTEAWLQGGVGLELLAQPDGSDCTRAAVESLLAQAKGRGVKALLGFGGGRMIDLAKAAAAQAGWRVATAPTSAATSACGTAVAVINDAQGALESILDLPGPPELCLAEPEALASAPARLLAAGLADTLAKSLEWAALDGLPEPGEARPGWAEATAAASAVEQWGASALAGDPGALSAAWDACLRLSSIASCLGQAPAAAAHSLANALGRQPAGRSLLHGEAVGLGLCWQDGLLRAQGRVMMEPGKLQALLAAWGLPLGLPRGLDLERLLDDALAPAESAQLLGPDRAQGLAALPLNG